MTQQEVFVERPIVVKVVAAARSAGVEPHPRMTFALFGNPGVAVEAHIVRLRDTHRTRHCGSVLGVARDTRSRVDLLEQLGIARIHELRERVLVLGFLQLGAVARTTRCESTSSESAGESHRRRCDVGATTRRLPPSQRVRARRNSSSARRRDTSPGVPRCGQRVRSAHRCRARDARSANRRSYRARMHARICATT